MSGVRKPYYHLLRAQTTGDGSSMSILRNVLTTSVSGLVTCAAFLYFLGHRTDYVGHYSAGFGGTLIAIGIGVGLVSRAIEPAPLSRIVLLVLIGAIGLGAFFEASIFRIAIFDPIDFCNQSLGAAIAALAFLANPPQLPMSGGDVGLVVIIGTFFLLSGFHYAFM